MTRTRASFTVLAALAFMVAGCLPAIGEIRNFDKLLTGTDKMVFIQPPDGVTWRIVAGSVSTDRFNDGVTFRMWLEDAPYHPYRDPRTGEMIGCFRCLTLISVSAASHAFFPIVGGYDETLRGLNPIEITGPNRLGIAMTPKHGALSEDIMLWIRLRIE